MKNREIPKNHESQVEQKELCGKDKLHELEKTGKYVFHGSPIADIQELEPRQPYDYSSGDKVAHGHASVVATPYADIAIFRSLVYRDTTGFGVENGVSNFRASKQALEHAQGAKGYVYVLQKDAFMPMHGSDTEMDWRAQSNQIPEQVIEVVFDDLPEGIELI